MRILVDTNVILDLFLNRESFADDAEQFFSNCRINKDRTYVTSMSLRDIEYFAHKYFHNDKMAREMLSDTYSLIGKVVGISADAAIESIYSDIKDYEDSLIVSTAKIEMLDLIITNNTKDFIGCGFPVLTPKEYNEINERVKASAI